MIIFSIIKGMYACVLLKFILNLNPDRRYLTSVISNVYFKKAQTPKDFNVRLISGINKTNFSSYYI